MKKYAYIRVSNKDQNVERQITEMEQIGLYLKQMFIDKQSEKISNEKTILK